MKRALLALIFTATILGCGKNKLSEEEIALTNSLRAEISQIDSDIKAAEAENARLSGGLVKALIAVRLEILNTNKVLLEQRINAIEAGAPITVTVYASELNEPEAQSIAKEIADLEVSLKQAREDASQYSGGLVLATKMAAIATQEQTLAVLQQKYLISKYGIAFPPTSSSKTHAADTEVTTLPVESQSKTPAASGPLGLQKGLTRDEIESMIGGSITLVDGSTNVYVADSAPKPHPAFENYALVIGEISGLCQIRGLGRDVKTSRHGIQLRSAFSDLEATLTEMYGSAEKIDKLLPGSIWNDPEDWMMGMVQEERFLFARWPQKEGDKLKDQPEIESVALVARAKSSDTGYVILEYTFSNNDQCKEEESRIQKQAL